MSRIPADIYLEKRMVPRLVLRLLELVKKGVAHGRPQLSLVVNFRRCKVRALLQRLVEILIAIRPFLYLGLGDGKLVS